MFRHFAIGALLTLALTTNARAAGKPLHDKAYWQAIVRSDYAVPAGESAFALVRELNALLGSPDPELRDRLAYQIVGVWVSGRVPFTAEELAKLQEEWQANLRDDKTVLKRSFSALCLTALVERDLEQPFLDAARYRALLDAALEYLAAERDLRGYDERHGWVHATAHTADLLAALARHPQLTAEDQGRVLAGIARRLATAPEVFTQGEQDRLAQAAAALVRRPDFDGPRFDAWVEALAVAKRKAARTAPLTSAALAVYQNSNYFLQALHTRIPPNAAVLAALGLPAHPASGAAGPSAFVALSVADLDRMLPWYRDTLGFTVYSQGTVPDRNIRFALLQSGGALIELLQLPDAKPRGDTEAHQTHGFFKSGFVVANIDAEYQRLRQRNVVLAYELGKPPNGPYRSFGVRDPEGNLLQFFGR